MAAVTTNNASGGVAAFNPVNPTAAAAAAALVPAADAAGAPQPAKPLPDPNLKNALAASGVAGQLPQLESKDHIRLYTWNQMAARDLIVETARHKFYTVPEFKGAARAAFRLMRTDQFQKASEYTRIDGRRLTFRRSVRF